MSEIGAIKNAIRAERQLAEAARIPPISDVIPPSKKNVVKTATGRDVDISRGYNVRGPDGTLIPFNKDTPLEKAKAWSKNFYRDDFDVVLAKKPEAKEGVPKGWEGNEHWSVVRDKKDPGNMIQFSVLDDGNYQVHTSRIGEAYRGQGIGAGMYRKLFDQAKKQGAKVSSDSRLSADSFAVWQRFKQLGYPIKERPFIKRGDHYELAEKDLMKTVEEQGGIFEFDPLGKVDNIKKPREDDAMGRVDRDKPHLKQAAPVREADDADKLVRQLRTKTGVPPEKREQILDVYNDYKVAEDEGQQQQLLDQLRTLIGAKE